MQCNRVAVLIFEILIVHELRLRFVVQKNDGWVADLVGTPTGPQAADMCAMWPFVGMASPHPNLIPRRKEGGRPSVQGYRI